MFRSFLFFSFVVSMVACSQANVKEVTPSPKQEAEVTRAVQAASIEFADIPWKASNPKAPQGVLIHVLSGDPSKGAFNAIVKMPAGMKLPLHTHSADFNGVTLSGGMVHAAQTGVGEPLPKGSVWVQPANEPHVDECHGEEDCIFLVFFNGAIDTNFVDTPSSDPKMVVTPADKVVWKALRPEMENGPKMAVISGDPQKGSFSALFQLPAGMTTNVHTHTAGFVGAIISGTHHRGVSADQLVTLTNGGVWSEKSGAPHMEKCGDKETCVFAVQMDGALDQKNVEINSAAEAAK